MQKTIVYSTLAAMLFAGSAAGGSPRRHVIGGVATDDVDWAQLCASVQPVVLHRAGGTCPRVHPAASALRAPNPGLGAPITLPDCDRQSREFDAFVTPRTGSEFAWESCKQLFLDALRNRSLPSAAYDIPFKEWRAKYFGPWIVGGAQ